MSTYITKRAKTLNIPMVDAKTSLPVFVKPNDIKKASVKEPDACAFARSCKRTPGIKNAYFFRTTAWLEYNDKLVRYVLPPSMQKEIVAFDRNKTMEPGSYRLSPPLKSNTMAAYRKRSKKRPGRHQPADGKIKRKIVLHRTRTQGIRNFSSLGT